MFRQKILSKPLPTGTLRAGGPMLFKILSALTALVFSSSALALTEMQCQNSQGDFFKLNKIMLNDIPTWDLHYRIDDPIDGISRVFAAQRERLKCKFDPNLDVAPSFYCVADDGWKATLRVEITSSFDTDADIAQAASERHPRTFVFELVSDRASKSFLGRYSWNPKMECMWAW